MSFISFAKGMLGLRNASLGFVAGAFALAIPALAQAATVIPTSYDMPNGQTSGTFDFFDDSYSGSGDTTVAGAALSGGLGQLTDGVFAPSSWYDPYDGTGAWVGWHTINPIITFNFEDVFDFTSISFQFDHAGGPVRAPVAVSVNGQEVAVDKPADFGPFTFVYDMAGISPTDTLSVELTSWSRPGKPDKWLMVGEVTFDGTLFNPVAVRSATQQVSAVPVPATGLLLLAGLGGFAALRRRAS